jgi:hypothetical protein
VDFLSFPWMYAVRVVLSFYPLIGSCLTVLEKLAMGQINLKQSSYMTKAGIHSITIGRLHSATWRY